MTADSAITAICSDEPRWVEINAWQGLLGKIAPPHPDSRIFALALQLLRDAYRYRTTSADFSAALHLAGVLAAGGLPAAHELYPDLISRLELSSLA